MKIPITFFTLLFPFILFADQSDTLRVRTFNIKAFKISETITIDGSLSESFWKKITGVDNFTQRDPVEGAKPSEPTVVYIGYDESAIYIGAHMYDSRPDSIISRLSRKDDYSTSDQFFVFLDPYRDKRSGFYFGLSSAGTMYDGVLLNDDWDNDSWDGVWEGKVSLTDSGWTAEMRIPLSQLRYQVKDTNVWGINFRRTIARYNERDYLVFIPRNESGFVSHFAELGGLDDIKAPERIEFLPYITTRAEYLQYENGNPFHDGSDYITGIGADFKIGLGSNLTLDATVNPDFGQVEIDPAVINLSDVETFFSEKRPFFIEGASIFDFGVGGASNYWGFNWAGPDFFYSRRIGRSPYGSTPDADYVKYPDGTNILGAAKISGKIGTDINIGTIQALTNREYADIQINGFKSEAEVEPLAYYGVFRGQKEFEKGHYALGFISTVSARNFKDDRLKNEFNSGSYSFGIDGWSFLDSSRTWVLTGWLGASHITGSKQRIADIQTNPVHYFQRPDAKSYSVDSSRTSLTGYAGRFYLNRQKGNFFFNSAFGFLTPEFDVNDLGFMYRTDLINFHAGGGYSWKDPTDWYRYAELGVAVFRNYDFDGNIIWHGIFQFGYIRFLNYYDFNWNLAYNPASVNNRRTRGGPLTRNPDGYQFNFSASTDSRESWEAYISAGTYTSLDGTDWWVETGIEFRPLSNISISVGPEYEKNQSNSQWVDRYTDPFAVNTYGTRYVFGELDQNTVSANIRLNWTFNPNLSLQLFVQPLISSGAYTNYKELKQAGTYDFLVYGEENSTFDNENYTADPDGDGPAESFEIGNRDFNFRSLRGNAVLRWEYVPGSVLYFVWTQTRSDFETTGEFRFGDSFDRLLDAQPDNIFMIKFTYWFNM